MTYASREILRALKNAAVEEVGRKKTVKILAQTLRSLSQNAPANDIGPEGGSRLDAIQVVRSALRLCMAERLKHKPR